MSATTLPPRQQENNLDELFALLARPQRLVIFHHVKGDGDALGSTLGLRHYLEELGHQATVVAPDPEPVFFDWMPGYHDIVVAENNLEQVQGLLEDADLIFCLDFGRIKRIEPANDLVLQANKPIVLIDHHLDRDDFPSYLLRDTRATSTCELVFRFIRQHQPDYAFRPAVMECLYTGILTDTNSFRNASTTPEVHHVVAELMAQGLNFTKVNHLVFNTYTENRLRFIGFSISERLRVLPEFRAAYFKISLADKERFGLQKGDTEGLVNYALNISGMNLGVLLNEEDGFVKLSFRSVGSFSANDLASYFGGGGHYNAAGARSRNTLEQVEAKLQELLAERKAQLQYTYSGNTVS